MPDPKFIPWIALHFAVCSECGAMVIEHMDIKANHAAWHAQLDTRIATQLAAPKEG